MTPDQYYAYADAGYTRVPLALQVLADLETPLSAYLKLVDRPYSYVLESVDGGEIWARYSIIGLPCREFIAFRGHQVSKQVDGEVVETLDVPQPLLWIKHYAAQFRVPTLPRLPRFTGGLVGYFGYETIAYIEPRLRNQKPDQLGVPDILLMLSEEVVVFDNLSGKLTVIVHGDPRVAGSFEATQNRLDELSARLRHSIPQPPEPTHGTRMVSESDFVSGFTQEGFKQAVGRIKEYILEGDVMQVVLSQRMTIPYTSPPLDLYRALRCLNPSPYMFFMDTGDFHLVGSSPEILVRYEDEEVTVRPIAGTRRRGNTYAEDQALEKELLADPKELAEHLMLIDLGRNDAGRVAVTGTVKVTEQMVIERYSHVMHIVSNVIGKARPDVDAYDVLAATFPAGTVSGAPKIRAMEIIAELEPVKRGVYSGAVGYIGWAGNLDTAIAIRTAVIKDGQLHIQAGAGVVQDSDPQNEWEETLNKGRAMFRAVAMTASGLASGVRV